MTNAEDMSDMVAELRRHIEAAADLVTAIPFAASIEGHLSDCLDELTFLEALDEYGRLTP